MDRMTDKSILNVTEGNLKTVVIDECTGIDCCSSVVGADGVKVRIAEKTCVS